MFGGERERKLREALDGNTKNTPTPSPLEQLQNSPLSDPEFKDWLSRRLDAPGAEVELLLQLLAYKGEVQSSAGYPSWQEDVLIVFQEMRERAHAEAEQAGVPTSTPKRRKPPPGRKPRSEEDRPSEQATLHKKTRDRSDVVARYVAQRAAQRGEVRAFRRDVLSGRLRRREEADSVLSSQTYRSSHDRWETLISDLMTAYGWERDETAGFLIHGGAPRTIPLRARPVQSGEASEAPVAIELTAPCWATSEEVKAAFQARQRELLGGDNRPIGEKALKLFRFVTDSEANPDNQPPRKELLARWNEEHEGAPAYQYEDLRHFNRDYARVEKIARRCLAGNAGLPRQE